MEATFIHRVCRSLDQSGVRYAVVGGYAVALHGAVRGTMDVDIGVDWNVARLIKVQKALEAIGLKSRLPVGAEEIYHFRDEYIRNRNLVAWNFLNPEDASEQVDVIINFDLKGKRRNKIQTAAGAVPILGLDDLVRMKRAAGRPQDIEDANALEKLR